MNQRNDALCLSVLGTTSLTRNGERVDLRPRERAVLAALALWRDRTLRAEELVDLVWGESPPGSDRKALQNQLVRLRRAVGAPVVQTRPEGYALDDALAVDVDRFETLLGEARAAATSPERRVVALRAALACFGGTPFADLVTAAANGPRARLSELRLEAEEELGAGMMALGDPAATSWLEHLVADEPYRERRWWLLVVALYRSGQRRRARQQLDAVRVLLDETGLPPSADLEHLDALLAVDDPGLRTISPPPTAGSPRRRAVLAPDRPVGRSREREHLCRALGLAGGPEPTSRGRAVLVVGEEGVGKTALLRMVAADAAARGATVLRGSCDSDAAVPLAPFVQVLEELAADDPGRLAAAAGPGASLLGALSPKLRRALGDVRPAGGGGQRRLFDTVERVLTAQATDRPLLLVIDDLHLAPPTTRLLVSHLIAPEVRLSLLAAARAPVAVGAGHAAAADFELVELGGLDPDEVAEQLGSILGERPPPEAVAWIREQTRGNPFFVRELTRELAERGALRRRAGGAWYLEPPDDPPAAMRHGLLGRLEELSQPVRAALQAAAVVGRRFQGEVLAAMIGAVDAELDEARRAGVVEPVAVGQYAFRHEVLYRAVIDGVPDGARLELHEAAAAALEAVGGTPGELARHYLATVSLDPDRACASCRTAGDAARRGFAYLEAAEWYGRGRDVAGSWLGDAAGACDLLIRQGEALRQGGGPATVDVLAAAATEAEELGDGDLLGRAALALCRLGPTSAAGGVHAQATAIAERALTRTTDPVLLTQMAATASLAHSLSGDQARCHRLFEKAETLARELGDERLLAAVLPYAYMALVDPDELDRRERVADELVALGVCSGDLTAEWEGRHLRFSVQLQRGDPALSESFDRVAEITAVLREPVLEWQACYLASALAHLHGDLEGAERLADRSLAHAGAVAGSRVTAAWAIQVFAVRSDQRRLPELVEPLQQLVDDQPGVPAWRAALAMASAQAGDLDRAAREVDATACGRHLPRDSTWTGAMCALAHAVHLLGPRAADRARPAYDALVPCSGRMSWVGTCTLGPVDTSLAMLARVLGDHEAAARHRSAAERRAADLNAPIFVAEARAAGALPAPGQGGARRSRARRRARR